jgi:hypothetical protein
MYREITINVYTPESLAVYDEYGELTEMLGYYGEDDATELTINLPSDWTGGFYLDWHYSGVWNEGTTEYTDTTITAVAPTIPVGDTYLRIRAVGDNTVYVKPIKFAVLPA